MKSHSPFTDPFGQPLFAVSWPVFTFCLLALGILPTQAAEAVLRSEWQAPVIVQGRKAGTIKLPAGTKLEVVAVSGDSVTARWGQTESFELPSSLVELVSGSPPAPAPASTPRGSPSPEAPPPPMPPSGPSLDAQPPVSPERDQGADAMDLKRGWNTIQFPELPIPEVKPSWFRYDFDARNEKFLVYLPQNHDPSKPHGVIAWTNPGDQLGIPKKFEAIFDELGLVAISAERCGNGQDSDRRAGLLVSGILALSERVLIDQERIYASGFSGGGRVSALACFVHPEFFRGAISWCGGNFYKDFPNLAKKGAVLYGIPRAHGIPDAVTKENVTAARRNVRFVLITGHADFNYGSSLSIESAMKKDGFKVKLIDEPGLGHAVGSPDSMRQALDFVLAE